MGLNMNAAASLLGPLYDLYILALGGTIGMVVGYATLVGIFALLWWMIANRDEVISGFDLRAATIWSMIVVFGVGITLYFVMLEVFSFPSVGAIIVAASSALFYHWVMVNFEGEPV